MAFAAIDADQDIDTVQYVSILSERASHARLSGEEGELTR